MIPLPKIHEIYLKPSTKKILNIIWKKEVNISDIAREIEMAYNNAFANIKKLEKAGLVKIEKTGRQNNPSIISPLITQDINFENIKNFFKNFDREPNSVLITAYSNEDIILDKIIPLFNEFRKYVKGKIGITYKCIKTNSSKPEFYFNIIFQ